MIGQILRISPYEWSDNDHACTKLEVYGCSLQGYFIVMSSYLSNLQIKHSRVFWCITTLLYAKFKISVCSVTQTEQPPPDVTVISNICILYFSHP